jgi:hypothetical protein
MAYREVGTWSDGVEVGPPGNVIIREEGITNPGRSFAAAIGLAVPRVGCEVFEKQKTGRVA